MNKRLCFLCLVLMLPMMCARADQGGLANAGGSLAAGTPVVNPPGTLTIAGNALTFLSTDQATAVHATFLTSSTVESCSGGGRGGHVTCSYTFSGNFSGVLTNNGATQAINGSTVQIYGTNGVVTAGSTAYNSAYTPFYFSNTGQILRSDDLNGTNLTSYGTQGSGVGQFYGAYGVAVDASGRIYVADTFNGRVVRIDDMAGTHWTSFGTSGSGVGQFGNPSGISVDAAGRIYVMDTGNSRLVRMNDMAGSQWTVFSGLGSGVGQLAQYTGSVAFDSSGRIYVADSGNRRIVRMDDMNGTNWTTLSQSPVINGYIFSFGSPVGVALDAGGKIYVADALSPAVVRVDDMTGANWVSIALGAGATPHSIAVDGSGMVLVGGGGAQIVDSMAGVLVAASPLTQYYGPYYVFGATPAPVSSPPPSAVSLTPAALSFSQNVGSASAPQTVAVTNFGGAPLNVSILSASTGFLQQNNCPASLPGGSGCTASVTFTPLRAGAATGTLVVKDDSANLGSAQTVALTGTGTTPAATVSPTSLSFLTQAVGTSSKAKTVTLKSAGSGPLQVTAILATGPFGQTSNCGASLPPATSCTVQVTFTPTTTGPATGSLTVTDNAGTQTVSLSGKGR